MDDAYYTPPLAERLPLKLLVEDNMTTLEDLSTRSWVDEELRASLRQANVIFVQWENFRDAVPPVFPTHTESVFNYFQEQAPSMIRSEVAVRDEDYAEVSLHADVVWLPDILLQGAATAVVLPLVVNLLSEWLKHHLLSRHPRTDVKFKLIIESPKGGSKQIEYEGAADELWRVTEVAQQIVSSESVLDAGLPTPSSSVPSSVQMPSDAHSVDA